MGISFDRDARITGYRASIFRDALRSFLRTRGPGCLIDLRSVFDRPQGGAIVYEELLDRGFIGPVTGKVTVAGEFLRSKAVVRTPPEEGQGGLRDLPRLGFGG